MHVEADLCDRRICFETADERAASSRAVHIRLKNTLFTIISIEQLGIYLKNTFGEQKWKSSKLTPGYETKIYFSIIVGGGGPSM